MSHKPKKIGCFNCKNASKAFKIAGNTHHQCNNPKHQEPMKKGDLSPWDTYRIGIASVNHTN